MCFVPSRQSCLLSSAVKLKLWRRKKEITLEGIAESTVKGNMADLTCASTSVCGDACTNSMSVFQHTQMLHA